ncbi:WD repeat protein Lub1 [Lecanora helva]
MSEYKLSATLEGHEDDVRGVAFPNASIVLSASRDATVRHWKLLTNKPPNYDCSISSRGSAFINAITFVQPSKEFPDGLIVSGGKDTIIEVRQPGKPPEDNAEALLLGHSHNICALDVSPGGDFILSGSWDGSARIWRVGKWECEAVLEEHGGSVWSVLAWDRKTIVTGCADKVIRVFDSRGKFSHAIEGSTDVVRTLCRLPSEHTSGADFASAGNDGVIRLWKIDGRQIGELVGHENFIYSLVPLPNSELASSGEDRTVRIWRGTDCIQTITHPAISVWAVAACLENGDIVSGASDRRVRVFSRATERLAAPEAVKEFEESVKGSAIPQQQVGDVNKEKLPGPEFLQQKSGTKEGQVVMIREPNGSVSAHQWSQSSQSWNNVGTVVDAVGSSGKKTSFAGTEYDYVFDVDIEDGKPPLKLPYNLSQNPYEAATSFIQNNELPMTYIDQVANFITTNTAGATIGQSSQPPPNTDPWASGAYTPGQATSAPSPAPNQSSGSRPKVLPQKTYLAIKTTNLRTVRKKIEELNDQLIAEGSKDISLDEKLLSDLEGMMKPLEANLANAPTSNPALTIGVTLVVYILTAWPPSHRLPALDLLRLLAAATPAVAEYRADASGIVDIVATGGFEDKDRENNIMLAVRSFGNLFETSQGRSLADKEFDRIHELVKSSSAETSNRNLIIAAATLYLNYAVLLTSPSHSSLPSSIDRGLLLLDDLTSLINTAVDSEAVYRSLVAVGTLLSLGEEIHEAAKEVYDLSAALEKGEKVVKEPRVKGVVAEIRALLKA